MAMYRILGLSAPTRPRARFPADTRHNDTTRPAGLWRRGLCRCPACAARWLVGASCSPLHCLSGSLLSREGEGSCGEELWGRALAPRDGNDYGRTAREPMYTLKLCIIHCFRCLLYTITAQCKIYPMTYALFARLVGRYNEIGSSASHAVRRPCLEVRRITPFPEPSPAPFRALLPWNDLCLQLPPPST